MSAPSPEVAALDAAPELVATALDPEPLDDLGDDFEEIENHFEEVENHFEEVENRFEEVDGPTPALPSTRATRNTWSLQAPGAPSSIGKTPLLAALAAVVGGTVAFALLWHPDPSTPQVSSGSPSERSASPATGSPAPAEGPAASAPERHVIDVSELPKDPVPRRRRGATNDVPPAPPTSASAAATSSGENDPVNLESPYATASAVPPGAKAPPAGSPVK